MIVKLTLVLGILIIVLSPITAFGMFVMDQTFWYILDIIVMIASPVIGFLVIFKLQSKAT